MDKVLVKTAASKGKQYFRQEQSEKENHRPPSRNTRSTAMKYSAFYSQSTISDGLSDDSDDSYSLASDDLFWFRDVRRRLRIHTVSLVKDPSELGLDKRAFNRMMKVNQLHRRNFVLRTAEDGSGSYWFVKALSDPARGEREWHINQMLKGSGHSGFLTAEAGWHGKITKESKKKDAFFLVIPFIRSAVTLERIISKTRMKSDKQLMEGLVQLVKTLSATHPTQMLRENDPTSISFCHGDLAADQVLCGDDGKWYLIDFGLSSVTIARNGGTFTISSTSSGQKDDLVEVVTLFQRAVKDPTLKRQLAKLTQGAAYAPNKVLNQVQQLVDCLP